MMIYVTHLWDSIRDQYIESRNRNYEVYCRKFLQDQRSHHYGRIKEDYLFSSVQYNKKLALGQSQQFMKFQSLSLNAPKDLLTDKIGLSDLDKSFECPIPRMPKFLRMYQNFTTVYMCCSTIKYGIVSLIQFEWFGINKTYACYLPGRLGLLLMVAHELPWFAFLLYGLFALARFIWLIRFKRLELDCLLFLSYDRDTILDKQFGIVELNSSKPPQVSYRKYLCNQIFYDKHEIAGHIKYVMKEHRTVEYHERLKVVANILVMLTYIMMITVYIPLVIYCSYLAMTPEFFEVNYSPCKSFTYINNTVDVVFGRSLYDMFRLGYYIFDLLDNLIFWFHMVLVLIVPYSIGILTTHDLNLRFDALSQRVSDINDRFRFLLRDCSHDRDLTSSKMTHSTMKTIQRLESESELIFNETVSLFGQVESVDEYMRRFSSYILLCWLLIHLSLQAFSILRIELLSSNQLLFYIFSEVYTHVATACVFMLIARPYSRTQYLYTRLSSAMALCPNIPTNKIAWLWILEYYHGRSSRHTLHLLGQSYALSNLNILRFMSWFVTGTLVIINLMRQKVLI